MSFLLQSGMKDLRRRLRDRVALVIWLGVPLMLGGLMGLLFGGGGGAPPTARVLLVDQDDSLLTGLLGGGGGALGSFLEMEEVELDEGRKRIDAGDGTALLIIPEGFTEAVLQETDTTLTLITNPAQRILPAIVQEGLEIVVEAAFYLQRLFGDLLPQVLQAPADGNFPADTLVAALSVDINQRLQQLEPMLFPPVLTIADETAAPEESDDGDGFNFGLLFLPGTLFMSLLFFAQGLSDEVWIEKEHGTLRRFRSTPRTVEQLLGGKLVAGTLLMGAVSLVGLGLAVGIFGTPLERLPLALVWCTFTGVVLLNYFLFLQTLASSQRGANLVTTIIIFPLMMIGGSFFPFEAMPEWMRAIGRWTPNGLALVRLKEILAGGAAAADLATTTLAIGVPAAIAFLLCGRRLRGPFATR